MAPAPTIFWFRRDLRLADNPALVETARESGGDVLGVFVFDDRFLAPAGPTRAAYLFATLRSLDESMGGSLCLRHGDPAKVLAQLASQTGASVVVATGDFGPIGRARDLEVARVLASAGVEVRFVDSPYVVTPGTVRTRTGQPCRVFGAFRRGWAPLISSACVAVPEVRWRRSVSDPLDDVRAVASTTRPWYFADLPDGPASNLPGVGESWAHEQLEEFATRVERYGAERNRPDLDSTSRLSAALRFGVLHPRQVLARVGGDTGSRATYASEICWREFYADVLWHHPESVREVLQPSMTHLEVDRDERAAERFATWARGETGYALVDAGMRQLLSEGWVHNRVRMVCASFLVKHLHLDWRWGARWFMWRLVDADLASNQHGWQWTAGTGTDAAPFHRVFNPVRQAERFDPDGVYIRRYVRELASVDAPECRVPSNGATLWSDYPAPMVDLATERDEALARFATARAMAR